MSETEEVGAVTVQIDVTNEMIVIAAMLVDEEIRDKYVPTIPADRFSDTQHAVIWNASKRILKRKKGFDLQQLHKAVSGKVTLDYLKKLMSTYPAAPVNIDDHMRSLHWDSVRQRATQDTIPDFLRAFKNNSEKPSAVKALAERVTRSLSVTSDRSFMSDSRHLAAEQRLEIERRRKIACYEYGIKALDYYPDGSHRCIPGAAPGKITNITAVSGSGKSVLAAYIGLQQARRGRSVLYGAWEMGQGDTLEAMANISFQDKPIGNRGVLGSRTASSTGQLSSNELYSVETRMRKIGDHVRFFDPPFASEPTRAYSNEQAISELHRMVVDSGCEVIVYDLFERCLVDSSPSAERHALFGLQQMHKDTETHGIICTQQRLKEVEKRDDRRPSRDTILGSQAWVDISDTIIGVHLPGLWKPIPTDTIELLLLKQRFGKWPQAMVFEWDGDRMRIENGVDVDFEHAGSKAALF